MEHTQEYANPNPEANPEASRGTASAAELEAAGQYRLLIDLPPLPALPRATHLPRPVYLRWGLRRLDDCRRATPANRAVLKVLVSAADSRGRCWCSPKVIAKRTGLCTRHVKRCVGELRRMGILILKKRGGRGRPSGKGLANVFIIGGTWPRCGFRARCKGSKVANARELWRRLRDRARFTPRKCLIARKCHPSKKSLMQKGGTGQRADPPPEARAPPARPPEEGLSRGRPASWRERAHRAGPRL